MITMDNQIYSKIEINGVNATIWKFYEKISSYYDEIVTISTNSKKTIIGIVYKNQVNNYAHRSIELFNMKILSDDRSFCDYVLCDREIEYYITANTMEDCVLAFKKNTML